MKDKIIKIIIITIALFLVFSQLIIYLINYLGITKYNYLAWGILHFENSSLKILIYSVLAVIITILVMIPKINNLILNNIKLFSKIKIKGNIINYFIITIISFIIFYIFRITNTVISKDHWGIIAERALIDPSRFIFMSGSLTGYINFIFFRITNHFFGWNSFFAVEMMHLVYGTLMFIFILIMCNSFLKYNEFLKSNLQKILLIFLITSTGFSQFFFGWWEGTTAGFMWTILYIHTSYLFLRKKISFVYPVLVFWLAFFFHAVAFWFAPSLLFLYFVNTKVKKLSFKNFFKGIFSVKFLKLILLLLIPTILLFIIYEISLYNGFGVHIYNIEQVKIGNLLGGGDATLFIPLTSSGIDTVWEHFTMFSFAHFIEFLNLNILNMPFGLLPLIFLLIIYKKKINLKDPFIHYLLIFISFFLMCMITFNLDYMEKAVWDIYSPLGVLYTILNSYILINCADKNTFETVALIMIIAGLAITIPWVLSNSAYAYLLQ